jgi:hypothetical protein
MLTMATQPAKHLTEGDVSVANSAQSAEHQGRLRTGLILVSMTMAYNAVEAMVALWTAYRDRSVSLEAFGLDSIIEMVLAAVLLWRLPLEIRHADPDRVEAAERRSNWWAGVVFYSLAAVIVLNTGPSVPTWSETPLPG